MATRPGQRTKKRWKDPPFFMGKLNYKWPFSIASYVMFAYRRVNYVIIIHSIIGLVLLGKSTGHHGFYHGFYHEI